MYERLYIQECFLRYDESFLHLRDALLGLAHRRNLQGSSFQVPAVTIALSDGYLLWFQKRRHDITSWLAVACVSKVLLLICVFAFTMPRPRALHKRSNENIKTLSDLASYMVSTSFDIFRGFFFLSSLYHYAAMRLASLVFVLRNLCSIFILDCFA
jgi:hypothetical protein